MRAVIRVDAVPERLDDWIAVDNPMRALDAFVDEFDLPKLG